ncbi:family 1 glycosylhydrolase [Microbacterium sp. ARD31]|uniref:glycoside hydrolase family 1 protein n=1 Tax=Microbacterium sp. ARD31 TaxID=2962576 RepID=UPI002881D8C8|nr:family 1 glycosylhydrolase [Microbacterium sp. ARD31]MDT0186135.1 family 1 glycosylhydrolase [Microbacterium sp. ARD31]
MTTREFPPDFLWGAAAASYQIEGAVDADGRGPSIWDTFVRVPGAILNGDDADVACEHYERMPQDVALMERLGLGSYRFSTAWPRVCPDGKRVNPAGLDFYSRLTDELLAAGITPFLTLYHWDLPQALEDEGGWTNRDTAHRFLDYAMVVHDALGDRVDSWTTHNEPWCSAFMGYTSGGHAPGRQEGVAGVVAAHHLLLGHGLFVEEFRRRGGTPDRGKSVGITLNPTVADPFDPTREADVDAARRLDGFHNRVFLDPLLRGAYADDLARDTEGMLFDGRPWQDVVHDGDLALISQPLDFLGVNFYHGDVPAALRYDAAPGELLGSRIEHSPRPRESPYPGGGFVFPRTGRPTTDRDWEIDPDAFRRLLVRLRDDYDAPPIYITENGAMADDVVEDGAIHDVGRQHYIEQHLHAVLDAIDEGVDVRGYFVWSLMDNFEWSYGYAHRFGIVHVDYDTQVRTPKDSALWFAEVAARNALQ